MYETGNICISWRRKIIRRSVFNLYHGDHGGTFLGNTEQDRFRKKFYAVGGNAEACRLSGVRSRMVTITAYVASGFYSGACRNCVYQYEPAGNRKGGAGI